MLDGSRLLKVCIAETIGKNKNYSNSSVNLNETLYNHENTTKFRDYFGSVEIEDFETLKHILKIYATPIICVIGIIGNLLNLLVLTRKRMQTGIDSMKKSAHLGLIALAVADLLYCTFLILVTFMDSETPVFFHFSFVFIKMFGAPIKNILSMFSTYITVMIAVGRYAAICYPLHAKQFVNVTATRLFIMACFLLPVITFMPYFWTYRLHIFNCPNFTGVDFIYSVDTGLLSSKPIAKKSFDYIQLLIGFFIPFLILLFCNFKLIMALKASWRFRQAQSVPVSQNQSKPITPTLVAMIFLFLVLSSPSECINLSFHFIEKKQTEIGLLILEIANILQTCNFAVNFILYCAVNVHFRATLADSFRRFSRKHGYNEIEGQRLQNMTTTTNVNITTKTTPFV